MLPALLVAASAQWAAQPNVVLMLADDLGWNDVAWHGSPQIPTPNIDKVCQSGTKLNRYYGQPVCSPTRSTILSGINVIHTGVYNPLGGAQKLDVMYKLLPEYFKEQGYDTHMVGKWHLGFNTMSALPVRRGFDSHLGFWQGAEDYYDHTFNGGYDFADGTETVFEYKGTYSMYTFTERVVDLLRTNYSSSEPHNPFFMYAAFQNVHSPLQAPEEFVDRFSSIENYERKLACAMGAVLDEAVGNITAALEEVGELDNTIVIFSSDNGGPTNGAAGCEANNFPLRGGKGGLWEGGIRLAACLSGPGVPKGGEWNGLMHTADWMPTLLEAVGAPVPELEPIGSGMSVWSSLTTLNQTSPRTELVVEAHAANRMIHGNVMIAGDLKLLWMGGNPPLQAGWTPPPGQDPSKVSYTVDCAPPPAEIQTNCTTGWCLFNLTEDPCEHNDISAQYPDTVIELSARLQPYRDVAVPPVSAVGCRPQINAEGAWRPCA